MRPTQAARILLLFLVVATTGFRFNNGLIYDDVHVIEISGVIHQHHRALEVFGQPTMFISSRPIENPSVDTYRPIPVLSFFVNSMMSGQKLWSYHLTNLLLHVVCVQLLYALLLRWLGGKKIKAATIGAAFFAVHPWLAEAHVWINGRSDPFALAFGLGAALVLLHRAPSPKRLLLAGLLFLCGLLSKETLLMTLPAFLFLDRKGTLSWKERLLRVVPLGIAAIVYLALRVRVLHGMKTHQDNRTLTDAMLRGPALVFDALVNLVVPTLPFLRSLRDDFNALPRPLLYASFGALAIAAFLVFRYRTRWPRGPFASLFFVGSLAPVAGITVVLWPGYGRYLYLPAAALALALADLAAFALPRVKRPKLVLAAIGAYLVVMSALLVSFTFDMARDETLYLAATERRPNQAYSWGSLGLSYAYAEQDDLAIGALKKAIAIEPNQQRFGSQLAAVLARQQRCEEARSIANDGIARFHGPNSLATYHLALAACADSAASAAQELRACLVLRPKREDCKELLTHLLTTHPEAARARAALRRLMADSPSKAFDDAWRPLAEEKDR